MVAPFLFSLASTAAERKLSVSVEAQELNSEGSGRKEAYFLLQRKQDLHSSSYNSLYGGCCLTWLGRAKREENGEKAINLCKTSRFVHLCCIGNLNRVALFQHMRDGGSAERALPHAPDPHDGPLGAQGLHSHPAQAARHAEAALRPGQAQVSSEACTQA